MRGVAESQWQRIYRAQTNFLQYISASYDFDFIILLKFFGGVGRRPKTSRLDFGGNPDHDPGPGFLEKTLDLNQDLDSRASVKAVENILVIIIIIIYPR